MKTICTTVPFTTQERARITAAGRIVCDGTHVSFRALVRRLAMKAVEQIEAIERIEADAKKKGE